jgi:hypothetical protein
MLCAGVWGFYDQVDSGGRPGEWRSQRRHYKDKKGPPEGGRYGAQEGRGGKSGSLAALGMTPEEGAIEGYTETWEVYT